MRLTKHPTLASIKYVFIHDLQGNVPIFMNFKKFCLDFYPEHLKLQVGKCSKSDVVETLRSKMVIQMRSGNWYGINCGKGSPDFKELSGD